MKGIFMIKNKSRLSRFFVCSLLCTSMLFTQTAPLFASEETTKEAPADPTPTPDPHTEAYYTPADTNSIKGWPEGPNIEGEAAVLMDVYTGAVLYSKNADKQLYPASITKIMTLLLGAENLNSKDPLIVSQSAAYGIEPGSSSIYADTNEEFTVEQALMAVALESANEMSLAIAEEVSGSSKKFVELMNERANNLGCTGTHFNNPNGLPDETHYTTAGDMAKIAQAAWNNIECRKYISTDYYEIPPTNVQPETRYMLNHHKMMKGRDYAYDGVLGGKTGYTTVAGNTLITYAQRDNTTLVAVVMKSINGAYSDTAALLDYGFNNFEQLRIAVANENPVPVQTLPSEKYLLNNNGDTFPFYSYRNTYVLVPTGTKKRDLTTKKEHLLNEPGSLRLQTSYYFNDQFVGWGIQIERDILSDLLM